MKKVYEVVDMLEDTNLRAFEDREDAERYAKELEEKTGGWYEVRELEVWERKVR